MSRGRARRRPPENGPAWAEDPATGGQRRAYASYAEYAEHQASKLATMGDEKLREHHERLRGALRDGLVASGIVCRNRVVLCMGARTGAEVEAFLARGAFAVGVDLNPGPDNRFVLAGDFHGTVFPTGAVDIVYTNAIDHTFDPALLLAEARRLLRPGGLFIVDAMAKAPGPWECFAWPSMDALFALIVAAGFDIQHRATLSSPYPWPGERAVMVRQ